jgi:hypothetical protein
VLLSTTLQGATVEALARRLGLTEGDSGAQSEEAALARSA